jgi:hypothetical protein
MASVFFSTIGQAVGGPLGGAVGALVGGTFDRALSGRRQRGEARDLFLQSSAYGETIPRVYGRVRQAGILIWALPMERGAARKSGAATGSYVASFAVALSSGPLQSVGRIWADGREFRDGEGRFDHPVNMRVHLGGPGQTADPLIAAAEGLDWAPAYRGLAYVVFENLPLATFGNRLPNLSFELLADIGPAPEDWLRDLTGHVSFGVETLHDGGSLGYIARQSHWREDVECLAKWLGARLSYPNAVPRFGGQPRIATIPVADFCAVPEGDSASAAPVRRVDPGRRPASIGAAYLDADREYQRGFQLESRRRLGPEHIVEAPLVATAGHARVVAGRLLRDAEARAETLEITLSYKWLGISVGDLVRVEAMPGAWRVVRRDIEGLRVRAYCEAVAPGGPSTPLPGDSGRGLPAPLVRTPPTQIFAFEPPVDPGEPQGSARLWIVPTGGAGWKGARVASRKGGDDEQFVGEVAQGVWFGTLLEPTAHGPRDIWDESAEIVVNVEADDRGPESRTPAAVLAGANLILLGGELVQFRVAEPLGVGRFRLAGLLRGRNASNIPLGGHPPGTQVCAVDRSEILRVSVDPDDSGGLIVVRAEGRGDPLGGSYRSLTLSTAGHTPLGPCHLVVRVLTDGDVDIRWIARHRGEVSWNGPAADASTILQHYHCHLIFQDIQLTRVVAGDHLILPFEEQVDVFGGPLRSFRIRVVAVGNGPEWLRSSEEIMFEV